MDIFLSAIEPLEIVVLSLICKILRVIMNAH